MKAVAPAVWTAGATPPDDALRRRVEGLVPLGNTVGLGRQHGVDVAFDLYRRDLVALLDAVDDVLAFDHLAEHGVFAVQPRARHVGDEELAAIGAGAGIGHRQDTALVRQAVAGLIL